MASHVSKHVSGQGTPRRLLLLGVGVLFFHVLSSFMEEAVFHLPDFQYTGLLSLLQSLIITFASYAQLCRTVPSGEPNCALVASWRRPFSSRKVPLRTYIGISFMHAASTYLTNEASRVLSYSTQVVFKSAKLLIVWIVRLIVIKLPMMWAKIARNDSTSSSEDAVCATGVVSGKGHIAVDVTTSSAGGDEGSLRLDDHVAQPGDEVHLIFSSILSTPVNSPPDGFDVDATAHGPTERSPTLSDGVCVWGMFRESLPCFVIVSGILIFMHAAMKERGGNAVDGGLWAGELYGVGVLVVALLCDAGMCVAEERFCFMSHNASDEEVMFYIFALSTCSSFVALVLSGHLISSLYYLRDQPVFTPLVLAASLCNYCGTYFIVSITSGYGSGTATMVTSVRKVTTVLVSYAVYLRPMGFLHLFGLFLVTCGVWQFEHMRRRSNQRM